MTPQQPTQTTDEQRDEYVFKHADTARIGYRIGVKNGEIAHYVSLTDAAQEMARQTDVPIEDVVDSDVEFRVDEFDPETGMLPASVYLNQPSNSRWRRSDWRTFTAGSKRKDGTPSSINLRIPHKAIERLGYEPEGCEGQLIEVWVSDSLLVFSRPQQGVFEIPVPDELDDVDAWGGLTTVDETAKDSGVDA